MTKRLYRVPPPIPMRDELMTHGEFYVPLSRDGYKLAAWLDDSSKEERIDLFKVAVEKDTRDLAEAYNSMCNAGEAPDAKDVEPSAEEEDDDDYGQDAFFEDDEEDED
jgi:hypothetical protein